MLEPHETSVRNVIPGIITGLSMHDGSVRIEVELENGSKLNADITQFSRKKLGLNLEKKIYIGIKAVSISVVKI
jgi:molybdate transport system regulatory protein